MGLSCRDSSLEMEVESPFPSLMEEMWKPEQGQGPERRKSTGQAMKVIKSKFSNLPLQRLDLFTFHYWDVRVIV